MELKISKYTLIILVFLTYSCLETANSDLKKVVTEKYNNGETKKINYFDSKDSLIKEEIFFSNGKMLSESLYKYNSDSVIREYTEFYSKGNRKMWLTAVNGTGTHLSEYYKNGNRRHEMDELKDKWYFWYENGQMSVEAHNTNGPIREYYKSGNIKMEGQFKNMGRVDIWKYYDTAGTLIQEVEYDSDRVLDKKIYDQAAVDSLLDNEL